MTIKDLVIQKPRFNALCKKLNEISGKEREVIQLKGLVGSAAATFLAPLKTATRGIYLFILNDEEAAGYCYHDLCQVAGENNVLFFPSGYKRSIKYGQPDAANEILRAEVIGAIAQKRMGKADDSSATVLSLTTLEKEYAEAKNEQGIFIVTYPEALAEKVADAQALEQNILLIKRNELIEPKKVIESLYSHGFQRVDYVYEPGQYAVRGSIIDVFSYSCEYPYRIDFFGDEIDSIRTFEVDSQLSKTTIDEVSILPDLSQSATQGISLIEFLPNQTIIVCQDSQWIIEQVGAVCNQEISDKVIISQEGDVNALKKIIDLNTFKNRLLQLNRIEISSRNITGVQISIEFHTTLQPAWHKNFDMISADMHRYAAQGYKLYLLSDSPKQLDRIEAIFEDRGETDLHFTRILKPIHEGFIDDDTKICYFTDHQIFDRYHKYNLKSDRARSGKIALSLKELQDFIPGDYIVHVDHGVGKFSGLVKVPIGDGTKTQEVVKVIYKNEDILLVSIHSLDKLTKYRGKDATPPTLNKLGSNAWQHLRERTKAKVKDMARELILLYAKRKNEKGYAFSPDTNMQHELEASFIYEETPDQQKASSDVKKDMESKRPMDRLICGDVGFGKTEIAIRAAVKAAADCKQVAVLVPTTVLALQHYKTFSERLKEYPIKIDYLTRARTAKEQKNIVKSLSNGDIDIIIGTHKLIGKEICFNDLGLLIIDEEQKFGVRVKEALRKMRVNVDTLTMTATPIPRTLQFSLMGARDLSIIATPPANRYPIQTEIHRDEDDIISEAINFELSRNGQTFYINNRISQLPDIVARIKRLVPDARVAAAHGQMEPNILEKLILDFAAHEYDVLVCTTIIEAGLDIPNANTIIISHAQNFGLSELHQLRGRVGRTNKKAFCYLLSPSLSLLPTDARRRLQAIENFSGLGSGIHLAMQDLDIRGAGNLLGGEQSGFIADLGYETYQKILREAVNELKTQEFSDLYTDSENISGQHQEDFSQIDIHTQKHATSQIDPSLKKQHQKSTVVPLSVTECHFECDLPIYFPEQYIPESSERISLYQELDKISRPEQIDAYCQKLLDRFGSIPKEGEELIRVVIVRHLAMQLGFERLTLRQGQMIGYFPAHPKYYESEAFGQILNYVTSHLKICVLRDGPKRSLIFRGVKTVKRAEEIMREIITGTNKQ